jgi:riboflavin-specific deaminase-like protein
MHRPRVVLNCAASLDGKLHVVPALRSEGFAASRNPQDHRRMRRLRAEVDAIVIGAGNLRNDDPDLALASDDHERRRALGRPEPVRVVVTHRGEGLRSSMQMFDPSRGGPAVVAHAAEMPKATVQELARAAELVQLGSGDVDIVRLLEFLREAHGCETLLCEGGGIINAAFFAARAVDVIYLTLVPRVLGGASAPTLVDGPGFGPDAIPDASLADLERVGDELFLRYELRW